MDCKEENNIKIKKVDNNYFKEYYLKHKEKISEKHLYSFLIFYNEFTPLYLLIDDDLQKKISP